LGFLVQGLARLALAFSTPYGINPIDDGPVEVVEVASPVIAASVVDAGPEAASASPADDDSDDSDTPGEAGEAELPTSADGAASDGGPRYTADLTDAQLEEQWRKDPKLLGSMSVGLADSGRMINSEQLLDGPNWRAVDPIGSYGTHETLEYIRAIAGQMAKLYPNAPVLRVNHISAKDGGYLRPHQSHQSGRDADLGFYYPGDGEPVRQRDREHYIDLERNWALLKAVVTLSDVQFVLVDRRVQKVLYDYALRQGENQAWLDSLFHDGRNALVQHARRHRDHFHVRFYNARAQELGRRVLPLLGEQPEQNVAMHRVKSGDTLGHIALKYGTTVAAIRQANHLQRDFLRLGITLRVPLRGPCTHCQEPPAVVIPPRRLPPTPSVASAPTTSAASG
jgi:murein endopeptidase